MPAEDRAAHNLWRLVGRFGSLVTGGLQAPASAGSSLVVLGVWARRLPVLGTPRNLC